MLIAAGADANDRDCNGNTPLHDAACYGRVKVLRMLIEHGANPDTVNKDGKTDLQAAEAILSYGDKAWWGDISGIKSCVDILRKHARTG
jgi:hypothetical protein